ncbi:ATP-binding protein [Corynebacterium variabile]|uniref:ATP-binding protein n=1 Tax=Corynebacterium variabile TaxID=1727 RepID=UPI003FD368D2
MKYSSETQKISRCYHIMSRTTINQDKLERFKREFSQRTKYGKELLKYLKRSECGVWSCEEDSQRKNLWWLNITLPRNVADMFDVHAELQLMYCEYEKIEPRTIKRIQNKISNNGRFDQAIFIVASLDRDANRLFRRRRGEFAGIDLDLNLLDSEYPELRKKMSEVLTSIDHFDLTVPVNNPSGFFGRSKEIKDLNSSLDRGQSIGVFGLRKTGKTSLLNLVYSQRRSAGKPVVWIDISKVTSGDDLRLMILEETWKAVMKKRNPDDKKISLQTLSREGQIKVDLETLRLLWLRDLDRISASIDERIEIFVDEIDQINPDRSGLFDANDEMLRVVTQLRGMVQNPDDKQGVVLVCAGVDPAIFERPVLKSGADNLLYKLVRLIFLSPLTRDEMADMVRDLSRRMGIRVRGYEVVDYLFEEYGGHALLTRKACSMAAHRRPEGEIPWYMKMADVEHVSNYNSEGSPLNQASEIMVSFGEWFPEEAQLIRYLWSSDKTERELARDVIRENPAAVQHCSPYGILQEEALLPRIRAIKRAVSLE